MAMAFSNTNPRQLAYISRETIDELPSDLGNCDLELFASHITQMSLKRNKKTGQLFEQILYTCLLDNGQPVQITTIETETVPNEGFIYSDLDVFSLCWSKDDQYLYYKDGQSLFSVSRSGIVKRIYSLKSGRMFFSNLKSGKNNTISFIERNNIDDKKISRKNAENELITIQSNGDVLSKRKLSEGHQSFFQIEGTLQGILGNPKWAYIFHENNDQKSSVSPCLIYVASLKEPLVIQPYQINMPKSTMPYYCILVGFNADESRILISKKFNFYQLKPEDLMKYRSDSPFGELLWLNIE
jgi:hypothetical protein